MYLASGQHKKYEFCVHVGATTACVYMYVSVRVPQKLSVVWKKGRNWSMVNGVHTCQ